MGEFTRDIKGLPTPTQLYAERLAKDREKLLEHHDKLPSLVEKAQDHLIGFVHQSRGTKSIRVTYAGSPLASLDHLMPAVRREGYVLLSKWLNLYGYKFVQKKVIVPKRGGVVGWFSTLARCHAARCSVSDGWLVGTGLGTIVLFIALFTKFVCGCW